MDLDSTLKSVEQRDDDFKKVVFATKQLLTSMPALCKCLAAFKLSQTVYDFLTDQKPLLTPLFQTMKPENHAPLAKYIRHASFYHKIISLYRAQIQTSDSVSVRTALEALNQLACLQDNDLVEARAQLFSVVRKSQKQESLKDLIPFAAQFQRKLPVSDADVIRMIGDCRPYFYIDMAHNALCVIEMVADEKLRFAMLCELLQFPSTCAVHWRVSHRVGVLVLFKKTEIVKAASDMLDRDVIQKWDPRTYDEYEQHKKQKSGNAAVFGLFGSMAGLDTAAAATAEHKEAVGGGLSDRAAETLRRMSESRAKPMSPHQQGIHDILGTLFGERVQAAAAEPPSKSQSSAPKKAAAPKPAVVTKSPAKPTDMGLSISGTILYSTFQSRLKLAIGVTIHAHVLTAAGTLTLVSEKREHTLITRFVAKVEACSKAGQPWPHETRKGAGCDRLLVWPDDDNGMDYAFSVDNELICLPWIENEEAG